MPLADTEAIARWRLLLGREAETHEVHFGDHSDYDRIEQLLEFLLQDDAGDALNSRERRAPTMTIPSWIEGVSELFPRSAKEVLERELVQRRGIAELLDQPRLLEKVEPNVELVKTLLTHRDLLTPKTRVLARKIIDQVVQELKKRCNFKSRRPSRGDATRSPFASARLSQSRSENHVATEFAPLRSELGDLIRHTSSDSISLRLNVTSVPGTLSSSLTSPVPCWNPPCFQPSWRLFSTNCSPYTPRLSCFPPKWSTSPSRSVSRSMY